MFLLVLSALGEDDLISREECTDVQKKWEVYSLEKHLKAICIIRCVKDPSVMTRTADILEKYGFTGDDLKLLRGGKNIVFVIVQLYLYVVKL